MRLLIVLLTCLMLIACGKTGALYLPEEPPEQSPEQNTQPQSENTQPQNQDTNSGEIAD